MKTWNAKAHEIERRWYVVDAEGETLGRLATRIADTLRGKRKPEFTPHVDTGDFVVVVNAEKISVTGNKLQQKRYYRHSGYPGGLRSRTLAEQLDRRPTEVIRKAVKGMLPRNRLANRQITKLKVYAGPDHPHEAQDPQPLPESEPARAVPGHREAQDLGRPSHPSSRRRPDVDQRPHPRGVLPRQVLRTVATMPLRTAGVEGTFDIRARLHGGGPAGQAGALRHGIARALIEADPELRTVLKREGFLTRDARIVERKKAGLRKARKRPQFSSGNC